jgi:hypothetical protein
VVIPTFRLKSGIFKPVVFNPFQTDADSSSLSDVASFSTLAVYRAKAQAGLLRPESFCLWFRGGYNQAVA